MAVVALGVLCLLAVGGLWQAVEGSTAVLRPTCSDGSDGRNCRCDASCALTGDCCSDAPSPFVCHKSNFYMMSSCPAEWSDSSTRYRCEHPDTTYQDPLFDVPVTSYRTNITYRNRHCALCHRDLDASTTDAWSIYFSCVGAWLKVSKDEFISHLAFNTAYKSWVLNVSAHPELQIFDSPWPTQSVYNCTVGVQPTELALTVLHRCNVTVVDTCPDDWADDDVRAQCEAHTVHAPPMCPGDTVYRNYNCGVCNNNGSFHGVNCYMFHQRFGSEGYLPDFAVLLDWHRLRRSVTCQQDTEQYDPLKQNCRRAFMESESLVPENITMVSTNETSNSSLDTCMKIRLEAHEYYIEDNDTMTVFISVYNMTLEPHEYKIDNESGLVMCWPFDLDFDAEVTPEIDPGLRYVTAIGISLSILFLVLHLSVFAMTPKLRNLSSMNLASLSVSLLVMYCSLFVGPYLSDSDTPCVVLAVVIHYTLLASFCWMLTIAYDINRVIRETTTRLLLTSGKHWRRFGCYSLFSWTCPAAVVGAALVANFSTDEVFEYVRPAYGGTECFISNSVALLIFSVAPLFVIMVLNAIFFLWSACLVQTMRSELGNATTNRINFHLYGRLALIMGLTWAVGLIAGYVNVLAVWYLYVILNALQGVFIFLAFTCTRKVWSSLCAQVGLNRDAQTQGPKSMVNTATVATWT